MQTFCWLATVGLAVGLAVSASEAQVVINMPAPSHTPAAPPAARPDVDSGDLALARYARARRGPRNTYHLGGSGRYGYPNYGYPYYGYPYYGSGFWWPWFGHHHHHFNHHTPK